MHEQNSRHNTQRHSLPFPSEQPQVHGHRVIDELRLQQDLFGFLDAAAKEGRLGGLLLAQRQCSDVT